MLQSNWVRSPAYSALLELLTNVDPEIANRRPLPGCHTVHEIVLHLESWVRFAIAALDGQPMPALPSPENWRVPQPNASAWHQAVENLKQTTLSLVDRLGTLPDDRLENIVPGREYTTRFLLLGLVQHAAYHGGQVALLRKTATL